MVDPELNSRSPFVVYSLVLSSHTHPKALDPSASSCPATRLVVSFQSVACLLVFLIVHLSGSGPKYGALDLLSYCDWIVERFTACSVQNLRSYLGSYVVAHRSPVWILNLICLLYVTAVDLPTSGARNSCPFPSLSIHLCHVLNYNYIACPSTTSWIIPFLLCLALCPTLFPWYEVWAVSKKIVPHGRPRMIALEPPPLNIKLACGNRLLHKSSPSRFVSHSMDSMRSMSCLASASMRRRICRIDGPYLCTNESVEEIL